MFFECIVLLTSLCGITHGNRALSRWTLPSSASMSKQVTNGNGRSSGTNSASSLLNTAAIDFDVLCVGDYATDSKNFQNQINAATAGDGKGGKVRLIGNDQTPCKIDGSKINFIGMNHHYQPLLIDFVGKTFVKNGTTLYSGIEATQTFFYGEGRGQSSAFLGLPTSYITRESLDDTPIFEFAGVEGGGGILGGLNVEGYSASKPTVWVHPAWQITANCPHPPCGATQTHFWNSEFQNGSGGVPLQFDAVAPVHSVTRAARSRGVTTLITAGKLNEYTNYGQYITVSGVTDSSFDGTFRVTGTDSNGHPQYPQSLADAASSGGKFELVHAIGGFDEDLEGLTLSSKGSAVPVLYINNFGNVHWAGNVESWILNGYISLVDDGCQCTYGLDFENLSGESQSGDIFKFTGPAGKIGTTTIKHVGISDATGPTYLVGGAANAAGSPLLFLDIADVSFLSDIYDPSLAMYESHTISSPYTQAEQAIPGPNIGLLSQGSNDGERLAVPRIVRFPNLVASYPSLISGSGTHSATTDPLGGKSATHIATTSGVYNWTLWRTNNGETPAVGDVLIAKIWLKMDTTNGYNFQNNVNWGGAGITTVNYGFPDPNPSGHVNDLGWHVYTAMRKITSTDAGKHDIVWDVGTQPGSSFDFAFPILIIVRHTAGLADSDIWSIANGLTFYPASCGTGQLCNVIGTVVFKAQLTR